MPTINFAAQKKKLTIGMCVIKDYKPLWFTIQSILLYHQEVADRIEFLVIDNDPGNPESDATRSFCEKWVKKVPIRYVQFDEYRATSLRNKLFDLANTEYVLVLDPHVLIGPGGIKALIDFFDSGKDEGGIVHGPLFFDDLINRATHMEPEFRSGMLGTWATKEETPEYFQIPGHGMGLFACRKDSWLRFPDENRDFGGEEIVIHWKYKLAGRKTFCLNKLNWAHLFRFEGEILPYKADIEQRVKNYFRGYDEIKKCSMEIIEHFKQQGIPEEELVKWRAEITS